jgi:hypothetical protein
VRALRGRVDRLVERPALAVLLAAVAALLFMLPIVSRPPWSASLTYRFLFAVWTAVILLLFLTSRRPRDAHPTTPAHEQRAGGDGDA